MSRAVVMVPRAKPPTRDRFHDVRRCAANAAVLAATLSVALGFAVSALWPLLQR